MKNLKNLDAFVESTIQKDEESSSNHFSKYVSEKVSSIVQEFTEGNPIKLKGDDVFVKGKHIGTIDIDLDDFDAGISFTSDDKRFSKEFEDMEELYKFLADKFNVRESYVRDSINETDMNSKQQSAKKNARVNRWVKVNEAKKEKLTYKLFTGKDNKKNKPLFQVTGVNNEYVGEWHTDKKDAQTELDDLNSKEK